MFTRTTWAIGIACLTASAGASAQTPERATQTAPAGAPWGAEGGTEGVVAREHTEGAPVPLPTAYRGARWPVPAGTRERPRQRVASWGSLESPTGEAPDPAAGHFFQMPTARLLRLGDVMGHYVSHLGWAGARFGLSRSIDVGVGMPYYFIGVTLDARLAITRREGTAVSWWAYASVPFQPDGESATTNLGFTWAHAGMGWITGPLVSVWGDRAGFHAGAHVAQRTGVGGLWIFAHATIEYRALDGIKAIAQLLCFGEAVSEHGDRARPLVGNGTPRILPYSILGARFYTRRFAADFGALVPLVEGAPLYSSRLPVLPWVSLAHLF